MINGVVRSPTSKFTAEGKSKAEGHGIYLSPSLKDFKKNYKINLNRLPSVMLESQQKTEKIRIPYYVEPTQYCNDDDFFRSSLQYDGRRTESFAFTQF
jgi:hypothetical protein